MNIQDITLSSVDVSGHTGYHLDSECTLKSCVMSDKAGCIKATAEDGSIIEVDLPNCPTGYPVVVRKSRFSFLVVYIKAPLTQTIYL